MDINSLQKMGVELINKYCLNLKVGGPFAALIIKDDKIVGCGVNKVLAKNDPTAHAEMEAIRDACTNLKTYDLTGCELYATGFPCPMCMSAIIWANIKKVYYSADYNDVTELGFRDDFIFKFIKNGQKDKKVLELEQIGKESIINLYKQFKDRKGEIY